MARRTEKQTEFEQKFRELEAWFAAKKLPVFMLGWQPESSRPESDHKSRQTMDDDGYIFGYISPESLGMKLAKDNRFPRLLGGVMGFDRDRYL